MSCDMLFFRDGKERKKKGERERRREMRRKKGRKEGKKKMRRGKGKKGEGNYER